MYFSIYLKVFIYPGVGVDIRVTNSVIFGLATTMEDLLQEGGRVMRGSFHETEGKHGHSFVFHKGAVGTYLEEQIYL